MDSLSPHPYLDQNRARLQGGDIAIELVALNAFRTLPALIASLAILANSSQCFAHFYIQYWRDFRGQLMFGDV